MILNALVKRYGDAGGEKQGWKLRETDFAVNIDGGGNVLDIIPLERKRRYPREK